MLRLAAIVGACLLAAGCLGGASPSTTVTPAAASSMPTVSDAAANATSANQTALGSKTFPVQYQGTSETGACAFVVVTGHCEFPDGGKEEVHTVTLAGKPQRVKGNVAWTSNAPGTSFFIFLCKQDGQDLRCSGKPATGASPIAFDFDLSPYNATDKLVLVTDNEVGACCPVPAGVFVFSPADFKVDATLTTLVLSK